MVANDPRSLCDSARELYRRPVVGILSMEESHQSHGAGPSTQAPLLSLLVPVFNEQDAVPIFLGAVAPVLTQLRGEMGPGARTEIIFVDDGSCDRTVEMIANTPCPGSVVRLVRLSRNFGKDAALTAGLAHAAGDAVVPMDIDLQDPPELLPEMVRLWRDGALLVNAVREDRSADSLGKRLSARAFYSVFNRLSSYPLSPNVGDFRLLDRRVVATLNALPERVRFMKGLFSWVGFESATVRYSRPKRSAGQTKWKVFALWNFALDGITGASTLPLRIWTYVGSFVALVSFMYTIFLILRTLLFGIDTPGYASTMAAILMIGSLNLVALGIIGEYVGRIAVEVRQRPLFVIDRVETLSDPSAQSEADAPTSTTSPAFIQETPN